MFEKGHRMGFMALSARLKHIFIVSKLRLSENFPRKQNSYLQKYSVVINYISINASGNSLRRMELSHRWVAVAPGILKVEQGAKLNQDVQEAFETIANYRHNIVARKPRGRRREGETYDAVIDGQKAELKTMTREMADANLSEAVRNKMREATKQGAE